MLRTILQKKVILPLLLLSAIIVPSLAAGAQQPEKVRKPRSAPEVLADIDAGKAQKLETPASKIRETSAVWNCDHFIYLTEKVTEYKTDLGESIAVSEDPDPMPPKDKKCVERNPTEAEKAASQAIVSARNAARRPPGAETRPIPPDLIQGRP